MPRPTHINLMFLGKYDLSHQRYLKYYSVHHDFCRRGLGGSTLSLPHWEERQGASANSPPVGSFIIFMFLPAGKKLFVITSLAFSAVYNALKLLQEWGQKLVDKYAPKPPIEEVIQ